MTGNQIAEFAERGRKAQLAADYEIFAHHIQQAGLIAMKRSDDHWQAHRGQVIVNYYPTTRKIYLDLRKGADCNPPSFEGDAAIVITAARLGRESQPQEVKNVDGG